MSAALYGYGLQGPPPKNRRRWLAWLIAVLTVLLAAGIPSVIGAVIQWMEVAAGDGDVGQAIGTTFLAALLLFLTVLVVATAPGQWRYHRRRDAAAAKAAEDGSAPPV